MGAVLVAGAKATTTPPLRGLPAPEVQTALPVEQTRELEEGAEPAERVELVAAGVLLDQQAIAALEAPQEPTETEQTASQARQARQAPQLACRGGMWLAITVSLGSTMGPGKGGWPLDS